MRHEASAAAALGVYKPRRPQASPLFRLVSDHVQRLQAVYDDRFAREYGPWRHVVAQVTDKFLACGILEHGFNRPRGRRRQAEPAAADALAPIVTAPRLGPTEATRRWAALLRQIFEVDPLVCPHCAAPMRIVAFITQSAVIDQILTHLRTRTTAGARPGARSPPSTAASVARGTRGTRDTRRRPTASTAPLHAP